ncbi:hypothetical protein J7E89_31715 [Streptomyces sp. ISL-100]|nr:hypothetical protein [Streptomyces sp. ISL-100]MBT2400403.1 hypothetical protein [Streptomyces sp. ISL-100]
MGDQYVELDPAGVDRLAAALVEHAAVLRSAARRMSVLRGPPSEHRSGAPADRGGCGERGFLGRHGGFI